MGNHSLTSLMVTVSSTLVGSRICLYSIAEIYTRFEFWKSIGTHLSLRDVLIYVQVLLVALWRPTGGCVRALWWTRSRIEMFLGKIIHDINLLLGSLVFLFWFLVVLFLLLVFVLDWDSLSLMFVKSKKVKKNKKSIKSE